jgi:hypothetical protein
MSEHRTQSMSSITDFDFIMGAILSQKAESPLLLAFANDNISDVGDIIALTDRSIDRLRHKDEAFTPPIDEALSQGCQNLIRVFNAFVETKIAEGDPIHRDWQNKVTKAEFDDHQLADCHLHARNQASTPAPAPPTSSSSTGLSSLHAPKLSIKMSTHSANQSHKKTLSCSLRNRSTCTRSSRRFCRQTKARSLSEIMTMIVTRRKSPSSFSKQ